MVQSNQDERKVRIACGHISLSTVASLFQYYVSAID